MTPQRLVQLFAWLCLAVIVVLSLVSPSWRPETDLPHNVEHAAIFALAGLAVGLGYATHILRNILLLAVFAAAIELAQLYVPGRHARWIDFVVDAASGCAGVALAALATRIAGPINGAARDRAAARSE